MGPIDDLDIAYDECIPWHSHHRHAYVIDENLVLDMNARGFQIGFVHREDGTDFLNTGYSNSDSRVESQDIQKRYDSTGGYSAPVKSSIASGKDDYGSSSTTIYDSSRKSDGTSEGGFFSYMKSSGAAGKDDNVQSNGTSGGGFFSFMKSSDVSEKVENVQSTGTSGGGFFSYMKSSDASGKDNNVHESTSSSSIFSSPTKGEKSSGGGIFSYMSGYGTSTKGGVASGSDKSVTADSRRDYVLPAKSSVASGKDDDVVFGGSVFSYIKDTRPCEKTEVTSKKLARKSSQGSCSSGSTGSIFCESSEEQSICSIP